MFKPAASFSQVEIENTLSVNFPNMTLGSFDFIGNRLITR